MVSEDILKRNELILRDLMSGMRARDIRKLYDVTPGVVSGVAFRNKEKMPVIVSDGDVVKVRQTRRYMKRDRNKQQVKTRLVPCYNVYGGYESVPVDKYTPPLRAELNALSLRVGLFERGDGCAYSTHYGDDGHEFCGRDCSDERMYCDDHYRVMYTAVARK